MPTNTFFAEDRLGPITTETSAATTVQGLADEQRAREELAKSFAEMDKKPEGKKRVGIRKWVGGLLVAATVVAGAGALANDDGNETTTPSVSTEATPDSATTPTSIHTVERGDTAWGIAEDARDSGFVDPIQDIRKTVDAIQDAAGADGLQPGERITIEGREQTG